MTTQPATSGAHALPQPTLWPAALALGAVLLLWGLISSLIVTAVGAALFALALWGWIGDIRHERRTHEPDHRSQ
jgi:hypothetical protein